MMFFVLLSMLFWKWFPNAAKFITAGFIVIGIFIWVALQDVNYKSEKKQLTKTVLNKEITETISKETTIQTDSAQTPKTFEGENLTPKQKLYNDMIIEAKLIAHADFEQSKKDSKDLYAMQGNTMALGNERADMFLAKHNIKHVEAYKADFMSAYSDVYNKLASEK